MPKRRISLADLHRNAVGQGQALLGTVPAAAPRALGGFDTHGISQHAHPTVADISECLFFSPGDGRIWLQDQRMVLVHTEALGSLRRELIDSIGLDKARGLLTRAGYVSGARDARLVRQQWPDAEPTAAAMAGTRLHALEGVVQVEVVHARYNAELGDYDGEFLWHNSSEDDEHIAAYGVGGSPACWMQVGYATGYVSTLFGRMIVFREVDCRSSGAAHCRVVGKSAELWDDPEQDLFYLNAQDFVGTPPATLPTSMPEGAQGKARTTYLGVPPGKAASGNAGTAADPTANATMVGASSAFNAACHMLQRVAPPPPPCCSPANRAWAKRCLPACSTASARAAASPLWPSTARPSPRRWSRANSLAWSAAPTRAQAHRALAGLSAPTAAPSSLTKSAR
ncbi:V4R domain-containing protein [Acidovorax sp. 106]|nr:V4R domain-containing protein [Acidovorax sp. 106]